MFQKLTINKGFHIYLFCMSSPFCSFLNHAYVNKLCHSRALFRPQFQTPQITVKAYGVGVPIMIFAFLNNCCYTVSDIFTVLALRSTNAGQLSRTLQGHSSAGAALCSVCEHGVSSRCFQVLAINGPQWYNAVFLKLVS